MSEEVNRKNIQTLMAQVSDMVKDIDDIKGTITIASNSVGTLDNKVNNLHTLIYTALVKVKGNGPTEPDDGD